MNSLNDYLCGLNKEQLEAATILNGPVLMLAGAGTGKTHTLMSRVAELITHGVFGQNILLLTFTNKAAREMKERIVKFIGEQGNFVTAMTFHAFCHKILLSYQSLCGLDRFTILNSGDDKTIMKLIRDNYVLENDIPSKEFPSCKDLLNISSDVINQELDLQFCVKSSHLDSVQSYSNEVCLIIEKYWEEKQQHSRLNFDDMLYYVVKLLEEYESVRQSLNMQYSYVMCDEYQDTNRIQDHLLQLLVKDTQNLCVVGDDNQSIYKFRGAVIENILSFSKRYQSCQTIMLTQNYRSTQEILDVSNAMMRHAKEGIPKKLVSTKHGNKPCLVMCQNDRLASRCIFDHIMHEYENGQPYHEQAILVRNGMTSATLEALFTKKHIPFKKFGGLKFLDRANVRDMLGFMRVIADPSDDLAWKRILPLYTGVGPKIATAVALAIQQDGIDVLDHLSIGSVTVRSSLSELYVHLTKWIMLDKVDDVIRSVYAHYRVLLERRFDKTKKVEDAQELQQRMTSLTQEVLTLRSLAGNARVLKTFLNDLTLEVEEPKDDSDAVVISTIHSAKGLEWNHVYLLQPSEELFSDRCETIEEAIANRAEERRVMYVALTRAKEKLQMVLAKNTMVRGRCSAASLSNFLMSDDCLQTFDVVNM